MSGSDLLVRLDGVTCAYDDTAVLANVDLTVSKGQFSGIVGPSGSGKTTLLKVLLGTVTPLAGSVQRSAGVRIGYVPQVETVSWNFPVTVAECVLMARTSGRVLPWRSKAERDEVHEVLTRLGIEKLASRHIRELSGGQQQRVFIARAMLGDPDLLLMDEPTSGVDVRTLHDIIHLLDDLHDLGLAIVLTTHDLNGIASHLPHIVCLNTEIIGEGTPREALTSDILERTYGARMEILEHAGMPVVLDDFHHGRVVAMRRRKGA